MKQKGNKTITIFKWFKQANLIAAILEEAERQHINCEEVVIDLDYILTNALNNRQDRNTPFNQINLSKCRHLEFHTFQLAYSFNMKV